MQSLVVSIPQYESHQLNRFHSFRLFRRFSRLFVVLDFLYSRFSTVLQVFFKSSSVDCFSYFFSYGFSSTYSSVFFSKSKNKLFLVDLYGVYIRVYSMYVPVLVVLDMDDECLSSYGSRRVFFFGVSVQGGAGEFEKEKSKRPIHTVELREIYIQAPKEGNLQSRVQFKMHRGVRWW